MSEEKSYRCPRCGVDISFSENGTEFVNEGGSDDDMVDLEMYVREEIAYIKGFMDAQNKRIDSIDIQLKRPGEVRKR